MEPQDPEEVARAARPGSLRDLVVGLCRHFGRLVTPRSERRLLALARRLPRVSGVMIECPLGRGASAADLSVRLSGRRAGGAVLDRLARRAGGPEPAWRGVRDFARAWADPGGDVRSVRHVWLEFDLSRSRSAVPRPCVFFDPADDGRELECAVAGVEALTRRRLPVSITRQLASRMADRPPGARVHYIGALLGREGPPLRLAMRMARRRVPAALAAAGWAGPARRVGQTLEALGRDCPQPVLNLDVGASVGPTVGVEIDPTDLASLGALLRRLRWSRLCTAAQARAIAGWPREPAELSDAARARRVRLVPPGARTARLVTARRVNHVKLVFSPAGPARAKVYLYAGFGWLVPGRAGPHS